jgi:predicted O-methyltransferase YrrM
MFLEDCRNTPDLVNGLKDLISDLPKGITMIEIGCYQGESTEIFMESGKVKKLYAVDTWSGPKFVEAEKVFDERLKGKKVVKMKGSIIDAFDKLPMVDFIYIDGNHSYDWVKLDIEFSLPKLKPGGIIAGHDYMLPAYRLKVVKAVHELLGEPDAVYADTSWMKKL